MRSLIVLLGLSIISSGLGAQAPTHAYVTTTARGDTFAVETYSRSRNQVVGEIRVNSAHQRLAYTLVLGEGDLVTRLDAAVRPDTASPTSPPMQAFTAAFHGDSMLLQVPSGSRSIATTAGSLPWINPSFSLIEQMVRRAHHLDPARAHPDSIPAFDLNGGPIAVVVSWPAPDSAVIQFANTAARGSVDKTDHLTGARLPDGTVMRTVQVQH